MSAPYLTAVLDGLAARPYSSVGEALAGVIRLHAPTWEGGCEGCGTGYDGEFRPWPCPTVMAIGTALGAGYEDAATGEWHDGQDPPS